MSLSLNYCDLGPESGKMLGYILTTTTIRELYLDGNDLGCSGTLALIGQCAEAAEAWMLEKIRAQQEAEEAATEAARLGTCHHVSLTPTFKHSISNSCKTWHISISANENKYNKTFSDAEENLSADDKKAVVVEKPQTKKKKKRG